MMKKREVLVLAIIFVCVILFTGIGGFLISERRNNNVVRKSDSAVAEPADKNEEDDAGTTDEKDESDVKPEVYTRDSFDGSIIYQGKRYEKNTAIDTVLFLGIDNSNQSREGVDLAEGGRSDTIILFAIDNENKIIAPLEINRDSMVDVDIYDNDGNYLAQGFEQLTMQYSYGKSAREACNLTKNKISDLLCRTRIDGVISLTVDGIKPIVDQIGGVDLKLETDETQLDPSYCKGAFVHLDGASARDFVHIRDAEVRGSNIERMSRQTQFMLAMFQKIRMQGGSVIEEMEDAAGDNLYEDVNADILTHFTDYEYSEEILMLPGENKTDGIHDEFYIDENKLTEMILKLFYMES
ncbi:LCP family protein [Butyrivibrio sp. MB2005]|uniref:LCP family protein n=1 Tax=Butyrivibrio sp. MB2005 TaxID=1280678 RepID=UPI00041A3185|nr:LCP family protein [Butyrivibrio sp. MB2005]